MKQIKKKKLLFRNLINTCFNQKVQKSGGFNSYVNKYVKLIQLYIFFGSCSKLKNLTQLQLTKKYFKI